MLLFVGGGLEKESLVLSVCTAAGQNSSFPLNRERQQDALPPSPHPPPPPPAPPPLSWRCAAGMRPPHLASEPSKADLEVPAARLPPSYPVSLTAADTTT